VTDAGYDVPRLAWQLRDLPMVVVGRLRSDRVLYGPAEHLPPSATGRPAKHGAALRMAYSFLLAIPFVGEQVAFWVFGGDYFGDAIPRFYVLHVLILPVAFAAVVTAHLLILVRQRHAQFPRTGIDGTRFVVGQPLWPTQFITSTTALIALGGVLAAFAVVVPWSDFVLHGPAHPGVTSSTNHPDWWLSWMEGALVIYPAWEWYPVPGVVISAPFVSGVVKDAFSLWLNQHPAAGEQIAQLAIQRAHERARAGRKVVRKKVVARGRVLVQP
jgi:ubiquinol-cytochrome c reductase cytochrome b subunit